MCIILHSLSITALTAFLYRVKFTRLITRLDVMAWLDALVSEEMLESEESLETQELLVPPDVPGLTVLLEETISDVLDVSEMPGT